MKILNWQKLDNILLVVANKLYKTKATKDYSMILSEEGNTNIFSVELEINKASWSVDGYDIILKIENKRGIKRSYYLIKENINSFDDFIKLLKEVVEIMDDELNYTQSLLRGLV